MEQPKLYMILLGCKPPGRLTEQHDVFFGIGRSLQELVPAIVDAWPEAGGKLHLDAWREVTELNGFTITVRPKNQGTPSALKLFFINLGGYRKGEFEEYHYKLLIPAASIADAVGMAKSSAFYKHTGFTGAPSHVDDKYALDVDDAFDVEDILPAVFKEKYELLITENNGFSPPDELHIGYLPLKTPEDSANR